MAKVTVNKDKCIGCGACQTSCPETFKLGADGKSEVINEVGKCNLKEAVENCPASAINVK